jgi:hypothetical protein
VLFLNVEFEFDAARDGGGYSELASCKQNDCFRIYTSSLTPSSNLTSILAIHITIPEACVPWLQA